MPGPLLSGATVLTAGMYEHYMSDKFDERTGLSSNSNQLRPVSKRMEKAAFPVAIPSFTRSSAINLIDRGSRFIRNAR